MKTDRIDYYLVHGLNGELWETAKQNGVIEFLDDALKKGKIINAGFSFHGLAEEFNGIVDDYDWTFCQIQYNYLDTENQAGTAGLHALAFSLADGRLLWQFTTRYAAIGPIAEVTPAVPARCGVKPRSSAV